MSIRPLSNLNTAFSFGIHRAACFQSKYLPKQGRFLCEYSTSFSTSAAAGDLFVKSSKGGCRFGYSRKTLLVGASGLLSQFTSQVSEFHCNPCLVRAMAAPGPKAAVTGEVIADNLISSCGNVSSFTKCSGVHYVGRSHLGSHRASISMRYREPSSDNSCAALGYYIFDVTRSRRLCSSNPSGGLWSKNYSSLSSPSYSDGAVPDVSLNASSCDEQFASLSIAEDEKRLGDRRPKLQSGSCYLPHPDKEETGGEDAHFICVEEQVIGVADGVGGWADVGVDAGEYARGLMSNSVKAIEDEPKGCIDPARVLTKAHSNTKVLGSSTACIIAITDQLGVHAINLGDSGFIVIRDGCTVFQSGVQQHGFNFPYQLENGPNGDLPSSGQVFSFPVAPGDVIVAGTDGLFDNLFHSDITAIVGQAVRAGLSPETAAQKIAALARQRALDQTRQTPFSKAAQEAGFRYFGGKLDDVTVVVAYLSSLKYM